MPLAQFPARDDPNNGGAEDRGGPGGGAPGGGGVQPPYQPGIPLPPAIPAPYQPSIPLPRPEAPPPYQPSIPLPPPPKPPEDVEPLPPIDPAPPPEATVPPAAPTARTKRVPREVTINRTAEDEERPIILGEPEPQGADWIYGPYDFNGGKVAYAVAAHGEGPLQKIIPRAMGVELTKVSSPSTNCDYYKSANNRIEAWCYHGRTAAFQETLSGLQAKDPTWITTNPEAFDFLPFTVTKVTHDLETQPNWPDFTFRFEGYADIYNAQTGVRGYSTNWGDWIREVMSNSRWGLLVPHATGFNATAWSTARQDCAALILPANPTVAPSLSLGGAGGNLTGTNLLYFYTRRRAGQETMASPQSVAGVNPGGQNVTVTVPVSGDALGDEYLVYRSLSGSPFRLVGTIAGNDGGSLMDSHSAAAFAALPAYKAAVQPASRSRYEGGGIVIRREASGADWLNTLRAHCLGVISWDAGKFSLFINKALPAGYVPQKFSEFHGIVAGAGSPPNVNADSILWGRKRLAELPNEVEIRFTDRNNNWTPGSVVKRRPSVQNGTERPRRAVYHLAGVTDSAYAGRVGVTLLNLLWDDAEFSWKANRSAIAALPFDVVELYGGGLNGQKVRLRRIRGTGEDYTLYGTEYQDASHSDAIAAEDAPVTLGSPATADPFITPPDVDVATVTWQETPYRLPDGTAASRAVLAMAWPDFSLTEAIEVWLSINGGASQKWFDVTSLSQTTPPLYESGTYTLTLRTRSRTKKLSPGVTVAVPVTGATGAPPDVTDLTLGAFAPAPMTLSFSPSRLRSTTQYAGWTHSGMSTFAAAAVNNGILNATAFTAPAGSSLTELHAGDASGTYDASNYLRTSVGGRITDLGNGYTTRVIPIVAAAGTRRFWRLKWGAAFLFLDAAAAKAFREVSVTYVTGSPHLVTEVHLAEFGANATNVRGYKVYDTRNGTLVFGPEITAAAIPTAATPLVVEPITTRDVQHWQDASTIGVNLRVVAVGIDGSESPGSSSMLFLIAVGAGGVAEYVVQEQTAVALAAGLNASVALPAGPGVGRLTAPGAATVAGMATFPADGSRTPVGLLMNATGAELVLLHDSAAAGAPEERILTDTGQAVRVPNGALFLVAYDLTSQRWRVCYNGGSMDGVTAFSPSTYPSTSIGGNVYVGTARARGVPLNTTTVAAGATVTVLSITGRGSLLFLSVGRASTNTLTVTVTIDGGTPQTGSFNVPTSAAASDLYLAVPVIGDVTVAQGSTSTEFLSSAHLTGSKKFESSITVTITNPAGATALAAWAHELY